MKSKIKNKDVAEDLVQEIWIKAFRAYENYQDDGRIKHWLYRITQNHLRNYFSQSEIQIASLDADSDDNDSLYTFLSQGMTPEDECIQKELISEIVLIIKRMPESQRKIINYRFFEGFTIEETAKVMKIPQGTVKSTTYYALNDIRKHFGIAATKNDKGEFIMDCKDIYKYLFMYAKGSLTEDSKVMVKKHIDKCKTCANMVLSLEKLIPTMTFAREDEKSHFIIDFPELHISFCGADLEMLNFEEINNQLYEWNGKIPTDQKWMTCGFSKCNNLIGLFDNEGNEIKFETCDDEGEYYRTKATEITKVFKHMWLYQVYTDKNSTSAITRSKEAPNLYYGSINNYMGQAVKSALYQAIPSKAENIRIKRGNGIIDCGSYKFLYVDRYVTEDEKISLDYSFLLN